MIRCVAKLSGVFLYKKSQENFLGVAVILEARASSHARSGSQPPADRELGKEPSGWFHRTFPEKEEVYAQAVGVSVLPWEGGSF